jgi:hypothetical protein
MTTENAIARNFRIIQSIDKNNRSAYFVQKRFFIFWLIFLNPEGFSSLEDAKQAIYLHLFGPELAYQYAR